MKNKVILYHIAFILIFIAFSFSNSNAITNGEPDGDRHPYVGLLVFDYEGHPGWRCTGVLISPTVVLTAGHCTDGASDARIWFDESVEGNPEYPFGGATSIEGTPYTHPGFCIGCAMGLPGLFATNDIGIVVLDEPVFMDIYGALPEAGIVDTLSNKTYLEVVGYGVQEQDHGGGQPTWEGERTRFLALSQLIAANFHYNDKFMRVTMNPAQGKGGACYGDSGGPDLLANTNIVLGLEGYATNPNCAGIGHSTRIDTPEMLEYINSFLVD